MAKLRVDSRRLRSIVAESPRYVEYARDKAEDLERVAISTFNARQRRDNEARTSETTPPKYVESFEIHQDGLTTILTNQDPAAMWVEFGAHAGGETPVLKYKPMTTALEVVANIEANQ